MAKTKKTKTPSSKEENLTLTTQPYPWSTKTLTPSTLTLILLFSLLVRLLVSLGPYSGRSTPPMYGDYEAQRHWMEIAVNLPPNRWYRNSTDNDLSYWGLDYPPLTGYQSFVHGLVLNASVPDSVRLRGSRGFESYESDWLIANPFPENSNILVNNPRNSNIPAVQLRDYLYSLVPVVNEVIVEVVTLGCAPTLLLLSYPLEKIAGPIAQICGAMISSRKLMMRWTVLASDFMVFFPAAVWFVYVYCRGRVEGSAPWLLAMILLNPGLILIDHGHFQYNCISLGLTLGAIAAVLSRNELAAAVLFSLAINHKQMSMYFAPAFFSHLLGKCLRRKNPIFEVMKLGLVVLATFAVVWWPYLDSLDAIKEVLSRLVPFERGIYEDYVANFWCTTSIIIKWKRLFSIHYLKSLSFIATVSAFLPSLIQQIKAPSDHGFLYALLNSSFSFYLFSYQVHEKSILLPLLPASLLAKEEPLLFGWSVYHALLSMFPLLSRDRLVLQYTAMLALFGLIFYAPRGRYDAREHGLSFRMRALVILLLLCSFVLHVIYLVLQPPQKYPFLFEALIMSLCFSQFVMITLYANIKPWMLDCTGRRNRGKKDL